MARKKKFQKYYSFAGTKWVYDHEDHKHYLEYVYDGFLRADDRYHTKLRPEDLPESFVYFSNSLYFNGFLDSAGVVDIKYVPNLWINHFLKDDYIVISYRGKIGEEKNYKYENGDFRIFGNDILYFLEAARKHSDFDISGIIEGIKNKLKVLKEKHPQEFVNYEFDVDGWFAEDHSLWNRRDALHAENWIRQCCGLPELPIPELPDEEWLRVYGKLKDRMPEEEWNEIYAKHKAKLDAQNAAG